MIKFKIRTSQLIAKILLKQQSSNQIRHCLTGHNQIWHNFLYQKILKHLNYLQNQNFSVLRLTSTQAMEMKQNQTFCYRIYSNLTPYHFLSKNIKVFQWLSKSKIFGLMNKLNQNNGNETKSDIFLRDIFKSDIIFH